MIKNEPTFKNQENSAIFKKKQVFVSVFLGKIILISCVTVKEIWALFQINDQILDILLEKKKTSNLKESKNNKTTQTHKRLAGKPTVTSQFK